MPGRRIPPAILAYLGPCREPESIAEKIVEQVGLGKLMGDAGLTDFDPLVVVMKMVADEVRGFHLSLRKPKGRKAWLEALEMLQEDSMLLEHNQFLPCRSCDQAFEPVVGENLLTLFLKWHESRRAEDLIAIHKCSACGGHLKARRTKTYEGDMHTPPPGSIESDEQWAEELLQHSEY